MRYLKLFESFDESEINEICREICRGYGIRNYTINNDGSIDVDGDIGLSYLNLEKLPLKFNKVNGNFHCTNNLLKTLEGSPTKVNGEFHCCENNLTSLEGSPIEVNYDFSCSFNQLTSFQYAPKIIRSDFECRWNSIKSFEYFPSYVGGDFDCDGNPIFEVWKLFKDTKRIELLNDFDIFRDEDTNKPAIVMDRLNDFLLTIGKDPVEKVDQYINI